MTRTVAIIQARFASTRLPGKVLNRLGETSVLDHVITRCRVIAGIDAVCCAVPDSADSDGVAAEAERCGADVFRGSETDVLGRYYGAAQMMRADVILRVTSDCPLIDPEICARVVTLRADKNAAYACNNMPPSWPHGLDCEALPFEWLERASLEATKAYDREHVGPFIRNHPDAKTVNLASPDVTMASHRWTLDTPTDMEFFQALWPLVPVGPDGWDYKKILEIVLAHPEIVAINSDSSQPGRQA